MSKQEIELVVNGAETAGDNVRGTGYSAAQDAHRSLSSLTAASTVAEPLLEMSA